MNSNDKRAGHFVVSCFFITENNAVAFDIPDKTACLLKIYCVLFTKKIYFVAAIGPALNPATYTDSASISCSDNACAADVITPSGS